MLRQANRRKYLFAFAMLAACSILGLSTPLLRAQAPASTFLSFDAPGAGTAWEEGTQPTAISSNGVIVGNYIDSLGLRHGFLRAVDGTFTSLDAPGALATFPTGISSQGLVIGLYLDSATDQFVGFLRYLNGRFRTFNAPGTTYDPVAINDQGQIAGTAFDNNGEHGFIWTEKTRFTLFDVPFSLATIAVALNDVGQIGGSYLDLHVAGRYHAFIRDSGGIFRTIAPDQVVVIATVQAINASGQAIGSFEDKEQHNHAFVTDSEGVVTVLPSMGRIGDWAVGINGTGIVVGFSENHYNPQTTSFMRDAVGNITSITLPFSNPDNAAVGINKGGQVLGWYLDSARVFHGWLMMP